MRSLRCTLAIAVLAVLAALPARAASRPIVIELFTSQGCSSCPPADALLARLAERPGIIAISLPVTYWDMLGWKDTLASEANTRRQKAYAAAMAHGGVYTPQIVVDGSVDVVGSKPGDVEMAISLRRAQLATAQALLTALADTEQRYADNAARVAEAQRRSGFPHPVATVTPVPPMPPLPPGVDPFVPVVLKDMPQGLRIEIGATPGVKSATIWLFQMRSAVSVHIPAGENEGRTIVYHNVSAGPRALGLYKGKAMTIVLPRSAMAGQPHDSVAVVVQQDGYGHVIGAASVSRPDYYASQ